MLLYLKRTLSFIALLLILFDSPLFLSQTPISVGNQVTSYTSKIRGYHFTSPVSFTICGLYIPDDASSGSQTVRVVRFNAGAPPAYPGTTNNFTQLFAETNYVGNNMIPCNITINAGDLIGVYGSRGGSCTNSYGAANYVTNIGGVNTTLSRSGMQYCPSNGMNMQNIWSEVNYYIGRIEMYYNCCVNAPTVTISPNPTTICNGDNTTLSSSVSQTGGTYLWSPGGQTTSSINVSPSSTTTYSLSYTVSGCPPASSTAIINVSPTPTVSVNDVTICDGDSATLIATPSQPGGTYLWSPGGQTTSSITVNPSTTTNYSVTYTLGGCSPNTTSGTVTVTPAPTLSVSNQTICEGDTTSLAAIPSISGGSYTWSTSNSASIISGQGTSSIIVNPANTTSYAVTYTLGGCTPAISYPSVTVDTVPVLTYTLSSPQICSGDIAIIDLISNLLGTTFSWTVVQNGVSGASAGTGSQINQVLTATGNTSGTVVYTVTPSSVSCIGSPVTITIVVNPSPIATVTPQTQTIYSGQTASLSASSNLTGGSYLWSPGGQTTSNITVNPTVTTTYSAVYTLNGCSSLLDSGIVIVIPAPTVSVNSLTICDGQGDSLVATPSVSGGTYLWSPTNDTISSIFVSPSASSSYSVTYTINGYTTPPATSTVTVVPSPVVTLTGATICENQSTTLSPTVSIPGGTYLWSPGGQTTPSITVNPSTTTSYTLDYTVNGCSSLPVTVDVIVDPQPSVVVSDDTICAGDVSVLTAVPDIAGGSFLWSYGSSTSASISVSPATTSTYNVLYDLNGCVATATGTVVVNPLPTVTLSSSVICDGDNATLTATPSSTGGVFTWMPGGVGASTLTVSPTTTTSYSVNYMLNGCISALATGNVVVNPIPQVTLPSISVCAGDNATLTATPSIPGGVYTWNPGGVGPQTISMNPLSNTTIDVTYELNGCTSSVATSSITVNPLPSVNFSADTLSGCSPLSVTLSADVISASADYVWNISNGVSQTGSTANVTFSIGGSYDVTLSVTENGCYNTNTVQNYIYVEDSPIAMFTPSINTFTDLSQEVTFLNTTTGASTYLWNFGDGSTSTEMDPSHIFLNPSQGLDIYLIAVSAVGCIDSLTINIPYEEGLVFYIPNTFTPDGDIVNQVFTPVFTSGYDPSQFKMTIYNRWGELIFETNNSEIGWDGTYGLYGRKVQEGVYTYHIMYKIPTKDERRIVTGQVNLIK